MDKTDAMEETSSVQLPISLLSKCKLTICDKIPYDGKLCTFITDKLKFMIIKMVPLVIEKYNPSPDDMNKLLDALKEVLQSHNRKDGKLVDNHTDSFELKQREGNGRCENLVQISSLLETHKNMQPTENTLKNHDDNTSCEVSLQQAQGSNDDELDLVNRLQNFRMNDVSNDNDNIQELNQFENNLSGNAQFQNLTSTPLELENENKALKENVTDAEKQENNSQDREGDKKQVETTQPEYLRKQVETKQPEYPGKQVGTTQPESLRKQVETTQPESLGKQVGTTQPESLRKQVGTTQPESLRKQIGTTQPESLRKQIGTTQPESLRKQVGTTQPESLRKQVGTTQPESLRKQVETTQSESLRKQVGTTQPESLRKQIGTTQPESLRKQIGTTQPESLRKQVGTTQPESLRKQVETTQPEYLGKQVETTQPESLGKQVGTTQPESLGKQVGTTQPESLRKQVGTTQPESLGKQVETTQPDYLRKQAESTQLDYPRKHVETTQPEYLLEKIETTQPEYPGKQVETTQPEFLRKQVETTQPESVRKQVETTQPESLRKQVGTTQPESVRKQVETPQPESLGKQVETTQPESLGKQVGTTQPESLGKQVETTQPESLRKQVGTTQPESLGKQVGTTQPESLRKQVGTTQPESLGKQVETTQPDYLRKQAESTQLDYPRKHVETTQPEYLLEKIETTQPEYPGKQVETTQPEFLRKQVETTQPESVRKQVETTQPESVRKQVETTQPESLGKQVETTQPESVRKQVETTQPESLGKQAGTTQPESLRKQVETTQPEYPRKQVETTQPDYLRKQAESTQPECLRKQDNVAELSNDDVQLMQNITAAKENEMNYKQKQHSRYNEHSSTHEEKFSTDIYKIDDTHTKLTAGPENNSTPAAKTSREKQLKEKNEDHENVSVEQFYRKTTGYMQCGGHAESPYQKIIESSIRPRKESLNKQDNVTHYSSLECGRQGEIDKHVHHQDVQTINEHGEHAESPYQKIIESSIRPRKESLNKQDNVTHYSSLECGRQGEIDKHGHHQDVQTIKENCGILMTNTRIDMSHAKNTSEMQPFVSEDADINKEMKLQMHVDDKNENHNMTSRDFTYRSETREDHAHRISSVQNVYPSSMNDIASQEHLYQQKNSTSANMKISLKDEGSKNTSFKRGELETSKISSRSKEKQDNFDSSDSDAESENIIIYSMKASLIDDIKIYLNEPCYVKYFSDAKKEGKNVLFKLNTCNDRDMLFLNTLKQLKVEECEFDHKDIRLISTVQNIQTQTGQLIIHIKDNKVHIVGLKDSVTSAKKRVQLLLQNHDPKNSQHLDMTTIDKSTATRTESLEKNNPDTRNQETSRKRSDDETTNELSKKSDFNEMHQRVSESHTTVNDLHCHSSSLSEDNYPKQKADKTTCSGNSEHCIFSKGHNIYYAENERSKLKVQILKADITKLEVDCIVNAANKRLQHYGGVAKAISSAAGPALKKECEDFIQSGNQVAVADIFVSTGGKMPAKCVIHAVGPKWESYDDNSKSHCLQDLRHTVIRCLVEAGRRGFTSIALPSISAAIFRVPKEACAKCYMEAVKHFGMFNGAQTSLHDIRFVDVDEAMVKMIQEHFQRSWTNPCVLNSVQEDCHFAKTHVYSATRLAAKNTKKSPDTNKPTSLLSWSSSVSTKTPGASKSSVVGDTSRSGNTVASSSNLRTERNSAYQIGAFTLHTDTRPAFNHSADITITVGKPFDKLSGLHDFSVSSNMKKKHGIKNKFKVFSVSKPKGQQEKLVWALFPKPDNADTIKEAIGNLPSVIQNPNNKIVMQNIRKVVLTSSILYNEPYNTPKKEEKHTDDRKKVGNFAQCLYECLSGITASSISIILVGNEDALQTIQKVLESRGVRKISPEVRQGARSMATEPSPHRHFGISGQNPGHAAQGTDDTKQHGEKDVGSSVDSEKACEICAETTSLNPVRCCGKYLCQTCEQRMSICPFCLAVWKILIGDQPPGTMKVSIINDHADGYEYTHAWEINYSFPGGLQKERHPNPGKWYTGMNRRAFLPINEEGMHVLKLLRLAFLRKLTFTIGRSLTTDRENSIIWNDIHHKTNLHGGSHGYPDSNYLFNITQELARKAVTLDTMSEHERSELYKFERDIVRIGYFVDMYPR